MQGATARAPGLLDDLATRTGDGLTEGEWRLVRRIFVEMDDGLRRID